MNITPEDKIKIAFHKNMSKQFIIDYLQGQATELRKRSKSLWLAFIGKSVKLEENASMYEKCVAVAKYTSMSTLNECLPDDIIVEINIAHAILVEDNQKKSLSRY